MNSTCKRSTIKFVNTTMSSLVSQTKLTDLRMWSLEATIRLRAATITFLSKSTRVKPTETSCWENGESRLKKRDPSWSMQHMQSHSSTNKQTESIWDSCRKTRPSVTDLQQAKILSQSSESKKLSQLNICMAYQIHQLKHQVMAVHMAAQRMFLSSKVLSLTEGLLMGTPQLLKLITPVQDTILILERQVRQCNHLRFIKVEKTLMKLLLLSVTIE